MIFSRSTRRPDFYLGTAATVVPAGMTEAQYERMRQALRFQRDHFVEIPAVIVACYARSAG